MKAKDNPFRTERVLAVRYRPQGTTWEDLMSRLARMNYRAAIVGPEGSGKTTLLEDLVPRLGSLGFRTHSFGLKRDQRELPRDAATIVSRCGPKDIILLDGAEQMGRWAWGRFKSKCSRTGGLIITSHRAGLLPTLLECGTTAELFREITGELVKELPPEDVLNDLLSRHRGNVREAIRELYDHWAQK